MTSATVRDLLKTLVAGVNMPEMRTACGIPWACPVPFFGDLSTSRVATVGINPSNLEFLDENEKELVNKRRRLPTLGSLGLKSWADVNDRHLSQIFEGCRTYFQNEPYDWFDKLDRVVSGTGASFHRRPRSLMACHLDLIPYATTTKWSQLKRRQKELLFEITPDNLLGLLIRDSPVRVLILNGQAVVDQAKKIAGLRLKDKEISDWSLSWRSGVRTGRAYWGTVDTLCGVELRKTINVLGYNHNIQGTPGVTTVVIDAIGSWISKRIRPKPTTARA